MREERTPSRIFLRKQTSGRRRVVRPKHWSVNKVGSSVNKYAFGGACKDAVTGGKRWKKVVITRRGLSCFVSTKS